MIFVDEFTTLNPDHWRRETIRKGLHRAGNNGLNRDGQVSNGSVDNKRWSMWYDQYHDKTAQIINKQLVLKGYAVQRPDPTRTSFLKGGVNQPYDEYRLYAPWLDTWTREWTPSGHVSSGPNITFEPGCRITLNVSFARMCVPGFRFSAWLMPVDLGEIPNRAYNDNPADGIEIDIFEYDVAQPHLVLCKCVGGEAGDTPNGLIDLREHGIDLTKGFHTIDLEWKEHGLTWWIDDRKVQEEHTRIPLVPSYLILSREGNSGVKRASDMKSGDVIELPPYRPADPGLYGVSVIENRHKFDEDAAIVDSIKVTALSEFPKPIPEASISATIHYLSDGSTRVEIP